MRKDSSGFKARHLLYFNMEVMNTEAKIVGEGDIRCGRCGHMLSSVGREVGLIFWDLEKQRWIATCASEQCSEIPGNTEVSELQNYWLHKTLGGTVCACKKPDIVTERDISHCQKCGGVC